MPGSSTSCACSQRHTPSEVIGTRSGVNVCAANARGATAAAPSATSNPRRESKGSMGENGNVRSVFQTIAMQESYIERILKARVYDVAIESPLEPAPRLSRRLGNAIFFKREDLQPVFSFKLRGAYNKIANLDLATAQRGVICASAGNHAQGVALAARRRGITAVIVMPQTTPNIKVQAVLDLGGEVVLEGDDF